MFQKTFGAAFAPPIRVQQKQSILVNEDEVGIIVQGEFRSIIPAGESLPRIQKRRFRTARTNQKAISITPAVRRFNGQIQPFSAMRLSVPLATKGVAWLEFTFRIDPDGRLTLIARDPLHRMKIRDIFVVQ
jgi:molecular chaperone DnaK (HSP70)